MTELTTVQPMTMSYISMPALATATEAHVMAAAKAEEGERV